jgi:rhamnosyltransferase
MTNHKATIVIPTYNGDKYLDKLLKRVFQQEVDYFFDVIVIDSTSKDGTVDIIQKYLKEHENMQFEQIPTKEYGHGKTRNYAARKAKGEFVVFLSQDAIPETKYWLYEMTKPFDLNEKIVGVVGKQVPRHKCVPLLKYEIRTVFKNLGSDASTSISYKDSFMKDPVFSDVVTFYSDVNSAARRDFLVNVIPYRDVPYAEDQLFGRDIIEAGYQKTYASRGSVIHSNDIKLSEYKHRTFDEIVGLRRIETPLEVPSIKSIVKRVILGSMKDAYRTIRDEHYSFKRKVFWLIVNPLYHIEKWRGYRTALKFDLDDSLIFAKHSLEAKRYKKHSS